MRPKNATEELMLFHDVHRAHQNAILAALAERGVQDVGQPKALFVLSTLQNGCATQRELADMVHVSAATMANSLKRLERKGYIQRQSDEKDSRCNPGSSLRKRDWRQWSAVRTRLTMWTPGSMPGLHRRRSNG